MGNPRLTAVNALIKVNNDAAFSNITLNAALDENSDTRDKALASMLFYGVLDRKITVDWYLSKFLKQPVKKLRPITREALRIGVYQLFFTDKIPQSAAVNESVNIVKASKERANASLVNAVLRNIIRSNLQLPDDNSVKSLSIRYSCPENIINSLITDYGINNTVEYLKSTVKPSNVYIRVNNLKITDDGLIEKLKAECITANKTELEHCLKTEGAVNTKSEAYKNGYFHIQDTASQKCALLLNAKENEKILDMCAAPGGKTFTVYESCNGKCSITACDIYEKRTELILNGVKRLGFENIDIKVNDAGKYNESLGKFNAVLCDVPCTGLGVLGRKPEIKYKDLSEYRDITEIQYSILENAVNYLLPNGRILYSTCTLRKAENNGNVEKFLKNHTDFYLEYEHTFFPHTDNTDGFYAAVIKHRGDYDRH